MENNTKCDHTLFNACEPADILKDVTTCVNCGRQMHYHEGRWYHWADMPAEADDSDYGIQMRILNTK